MPVIEFFLLVNTQDINNTETVENSTSPMLTKKLNKNRKPRKCCCCRKNDDDDDDDGDGDDDDDDDDRRLSFTNDVENEIQFDLNLRNENTRAHFRRLRRHRRRRSRPDSGLQSEDRPDDVAGGRHFDPVHPETLEQVRTSPGAAVQLSGCPVLWTHHYRNPSPGFQS